MTEFSPWISAHSVKYFSKNMVLKIWNFDRDVASMSKFPILKTIFFEKYLTDWAENFFADPLAVLWRS